jgi:spore coat polysaccharide biosynthesis protein SpsF
MPLTNLVLMRVEASNAIGFGHMMRCFALANHLLASARVVFITESDSVITACSAKGFESYRFSDDLAAINYLKAQLVAGVHLKLVVDTKRNYSEREVIALKDKCSGVFFIENNSVGTKAADYVIYPAAHFDYEAVYGGLNFSIPTDKLIYGEEFVIIREEISNYSAGSGGGLVVTTGASDPCGVMQVLDEMLVKLGIRARFLIGEKFDFTVSKYGMTIGSKYSQYDYRFIANADVVISAFGVSVYESLFYKKPTISIGHTLENAVGSRILSRKTKMLKDVGYFKDLKPSDLQHVLGNVSGMLDSSDGFKVDGLGVARISKLISGHD